MTEWSKSLEAFNRWKGSPSGENRHRLKEAIESEGGVINGHGVIQWAKQHLVKQEARESNESEV